MSPLLTTPCALRQHSDLLHPTIFARYPITWPAEYPTSRVSGGIEEKLKTAIAVVKLGIPVIIVQVGTEHAAAALRGDKPEVMTILRLKDE